MSDTTSPFLIQALVTALGLVAFLGFVAWQMRRDKKQFSLVRVLAVAFIALLLGSLPFAAAFWWFAPGDTDRHSSYLLAAWSVPIATIEVWGIIIIYGIRKQRKKHE